MSKIEVDMNVSLTQELENYVQKKVSTGFYTSVSEVIRESLRLMHQQENVQQKKMRELNQAIEIGLLQLAQGRKILASASYDKLKSKIQQIARDNE